MNLWLENTKALLTTCQESLQHSYKNNIVNKQIKRIFNEAFTVQ